MLFNLLKTNFANRLRPKMKCISRMYHSDNTFGFKAKSKSTFVVPQEVLEMRNKECNFYRLVTAYRQHAHKFADINPVSFTKNISIDSDLNIETYGFKEDDEVVFKGIINCEKEAGTIREAVDFLDNIYKKAIGLEFFYLEDDYEVEWFAGRAEELIMEQIDESTQIRTAIELLRSQTFDTFLANKFSGLKRYGGEGAESMVAFFSELLQLSAAANLEQLVIAMPHRGRLNLLSGLLNLSPVKIFAKLLGKVEFPGKYHWATGDVLSHIISSTNLLVNSKSIHVSMLYNPSHLEAVNPVSMGKTRAKQLDGHEGDYGPNGMWGEKTLNIQVHGDAAISAQGVNQECLDLSGAPHFEIGGTVHLVVNNQLGFTTPADRGRSSRYCTDIAKMTSAPVIHVNGDDPDMVLKATRLAFEYQRKFRKDVFIDLNCYRQWGHNELDDPTFTNPLLYNIIHSRGTVPDQYSKQLKNEGVFQDQQREEIVKAHTQWLNQHLKSVDNYEPEDTYFKGQWENFSPTDEVITTWDTGVNFDLLTYIGSCSVRFPKDFNIHPTLLKSHVKNRLARIAEGVNIDWATAEALAFGTLLYEGFNVRISGQDVGRGTFSHRHAMLVDQQTNNVHIPLNRLHANQTGYLEIANSILSEEAVLGYEYGMSIESPRNLVVWEAQFGDFFNGAQIIFDTFISCGESKWLWSSGLVVLLPHGYDGAGPEHSSARIERFLQLTDSREDRVDSDNVNMQVCHPSTPAQYFHLLRRQMVRNFRKPLIVIAPKTLLRLAGCTSKLADMASGTSFQPVIGDPSSDAMRVEKVLITSGKHYYTLAEKRESLGIKNTAIIRLESYCPFPTMELRGEIAKYQNAKAFLWCQEEPRNMGAWCFVKSRFQNLVGKRIDFCGRPTQAAPAVGMTKLHLEQVNDINTKPFSTDV